MGSGRAELILCSNVSARVETKEEFSIPTTMTGEKESVTIDSDSIIITPKQRLFADWMTAVLVYTVILNLFVEHSDAFVIDSFTISVLTAIVLKAFLGIILRLEHRVATFFRAREGTFFRVFGVFLTFSILFLSKFVILEAIDIIFGDHVEISGFIPLVALIITMLVADLLVHRIYERLGRI